MKRKIFSFLLMLGLCFGLAVPASAAEREAKTTTLYLGKTYAAFIDDNQTLWLRGQPRSGEIELGQTEVRRGFSRAMEDVASVCVSRDYDCFGAVIKTDGSLWMWGVNTYGQLGIGKVGEVTQLNSKESMLVLESQAKPVKVMDNVVSVSCGAAHTAAVKADGTLWMWGSNKEGQLGTGGKGDGTDYFGYPYQTEPVQVMSDVVSVSCGEDFTVALQKDGTVWGWGNNDVGQAGNPPTAYPVIQSPQMIIGDAVAISAGRSHAAAIQEDGTLVTWGNNYYGQLGNGKTMTNFFMPLQVLDDVTAVSCGDLTTAAIQSDGSLWMWGYDFHGELGNGVYNADPYSHYYSPQKIIDSGVAAVSAGYSRTAAVKEDGSLWLWGFWGQRDTLLRDFGPDFGLEIVDIAIQSAQEPTQATPKMVEGLTVKLPGSAYEFSSPASNVTGFTDVSKSAYYADAVMWAVDNSITSGTGDGTTFSPEATCTTAQILTFLWRANGSPEPGIDNPFSDVADDAYYADAAAWAYEKGLISGSAFGGNTPCTRSATVTYLWKLAGSPAVDAAAFADVDATAEYAQAVAWAIKENITAGTSATTFSPDSTCTRGQIVTFLYRDLA